MNQIATLVLVLLGLFAGSSEAQLGGLGGQRGLGLPDLGGLNELGRPLRNDGLLRQRVDTSLAPLDLQGLRQRLLEDRLSRHSRELSRDPAGELIVQRQLLALPSSTPARERLLALPGITLLEETQLDGLAVSWLLLQADATLLPQLRALDPDGQYDYQHIYLGSGTVGSSAVSRGDASKANDKAKTEARVGLIDSGVDTLHSALRDTKLQRYGCEGQAHPATHGTAVASLLIGQDANFQGALPGATLFAADVYCDAATGGSVQAIAQGLAWLARERVGVINISLVGPPNLLLQRAVAAAVAKGHLIVAAVGNDGPAAPPLYPAAWPGVVAVTGVDARRRVLAEAGRGPHLSWAAPGSQMFGAANGGGYLPLRGTSFAAPLVAGLLASSLAQPDEVGAGAALAQLRSQAIDLGPPGRDDIYGWGLVGERLRTAEPR
jgi:hypothetical protein